MFTFLTWPLFPFREQATGWILRLERTDSVTEVTTSDAKPSPAGKTFPRLGEGGLGERVWGGPETVALHPGPWAEGEQVGESQIQVWDMRARRLLCWGLWQGVSPPPESWSQASWSQSRLVTFQAFHKLIVKLSVA